MEKMKIISLEIKGIKVGRFFPKDGKAQLHVMFNAGFDKEVIREINFSDPESSAENIITALRKMEKQIHKNDDNMGITMENFVNIVVKDEDKLVEEISSFIQKVGIKIDEINNKKEADGYLDRIRELNSLKLEF